ncbi:MAG: SsgA family sporulation/cell division regulator [Mycobacteriaceae bacterium]
MNEETMAVCELVPGLLHCSGGSGEVTVCWVYVAEEPFSVQLLVVVDAETSLAIVFSRELLLCGLCQLAGPGEVVIGPGVVRGPAGSLWVQFPTTWGVTVVEVPREPVTAFVVATYDVVGPMHEVDHLDLDAELLALLS